MRSWWANTVENRCDKGSQKAALGFDTYLAESKMNIQGLSTHEAKFRPRSLT